MKIVLLERFCYGPEATFGKLILPEGQRLATVERPWLMNLPEVSCIPEGVYRCEPSFYHRGGYASVEVMDVEGRSKIKIHRGNYVRNSLGCILVNTRHGAHGQEWCAWSSKNAFNLFMAEMGSEPFNLTIKMIEAGKL